MKKAKAYFISGGIFLLLFVLLILIVSFVDVQAIGPEQSSVGLARINGYFAQKFQYSKFFYDVTDLPMYFVILLGVFFACIGFLQLVKRKKLLSVDKDILALGVFFVVVIGLYALFEVAVINYRPVIIDGQLEASFPSSHTMAVCSIAGALCFQVNKRVVKKPLKIFVLVLLVTVIAFTVIGRIISGVHWFTDIIGALLLSTSLVLFYGGTLAAVSARKV